MAKVAKKSETKATTKKMAAKPAKKKESKR